jgi:hypothetical protein
VAPLRVLIESKDALGWELLGALRAFVTSRLGSCLSAGCRIFSDKNQKHLRPNGIKTDRTKNHLG